MTKTTDVWEFRNHIRDLAKAHNLDVTVAHDNGKGWATYYSANKEHVDILTTLLFLEGINTKEAPVYFMDFFRYRAWPTA